MPKATSRPLLLRLYLAASRARRRRWRGARWSGGAREGKEDAERLGERMGEAGLPRPEGQLVWFHAASVGEAASLLEMLRRLTQARPEVSCLVTTGTITSAQFLAERLPEHCIHQFATLDVLPWVRRFLDHWRPDVAVWTESELWPATLVETDARGIPMLLINARISTRSFRRWRAMGGMPRALLGRFDRILAQDALAGEQLTALGADPDAAERRGLAEGGRGALALRRGRAGAHRAGAGRAAGLARGLDAPRRGGDRRRPPMPAPAGRCRCWR